MLKRWMIKRPGIAWFPKESYTLSLISILKLPISVATNRRLGCRSRTGVCFLDQSFEVRGDDHCANIQGSLADWNVFQDSEAKSESEDVRRDIVQRIEDADLDSIDRNVDFEVPPVELEVVVGNVESGSIVAMEFVYLQGFMALDWRSVRHTAANTTFNTTGVRVVIIWTA